MRKISVFSVLFAFVAMISMATLLASCGKDEPKPAPEAAFSYKATGDGRTIEFTNQSTNATSYSWDFGDGQTSTEVNPVHIYASFGEFTVTLTATGEGGTNTFTYKITLVKTSPVKLDDNGFDDWKDIPFAFESVDNNGGILNKAKVDYDADNIYLYFEIQGNLTDSLFVGCWFDLDNDSTSGFKPWTHKAMGVDLYVEGQLTTAGAASLFEHSDPTGGQGWGWNDLGATDFIINGYHAQEGGVIKCEFAFKRLKLNTTTKTLGKKVTLAVTPYVNWEPAGFFPAQGANGYVLEMQ